MKTNPFLFLEFHHQFLFPIGISLQFSGNSPLPVTNIYFIVKLLHVYPKCHGLHDEHWLVQGDTWLIAIKILTGEHIHFLIRLYTTQNRYTLVYIKMKIFIIIIQHHCQYTEGIIEKGCGQVADKERGEIKCIINTETTPRLSLSSIISGIRTKIVNCNNIIPTTPHPCSLWEFVGEFTPLQNCLLLSSVIIIIFIIYSMQVMIIVYLVHNYLI